MLAALQVPAMLRAEPLLAPIADPVRELHRPAAPGDEAAQERVAVVLGVPRTARDQHAALARPGFAVGPPDLQSMCPEPTPAVPRS